MKRAEKTTNALFALALLAACTWAFLKFAPVPQPPLGETATAARPPAPAENGAPPDVADEAAPEAPAAPPDFLGAPVASGREAVSAAEYAERLAEVYVGRGYLDFAALRRKGAKGKSARSKLFWRRQHEGTEMICAIGDDADPDGTERSPEPRMFVSVITPDAGGGAKWTRHSYSNGAALGRAVLPDGDFPGQDPPHVPRPDGLRRLFSAAAGAAGGGTLAIYSGEKGLEELAAWYSNAMAAGWRYEPVPTAEAAALAEGIMYFSRGGKLCLIWLSRGTTSKSLVVVSVYGK